ncbi:MAG: ferredoxin [Acidimicrobiia bacterium]|nr:ferredoxin [Acidimicrobiia bacterium]
MKVTVDAATCVGHGRCYALAPAAYAPDDRGHCELLMTEVPPELEEQAHAGEANCPERAISITP